MGMLCRALGFNVSIQCLFACLPAMLPANAMRSCFKACVAPPAYRPCRLPHTLPALHQSACREADPLPLCPHPLSRALLLLLQVKLQFESRDAAALQKAVEAAQEQLDTFSLPGKAAR